MNKTDYQQQQRRAEAKWLREFADWILTARWEWTSLNIDDAISAFMTAKEPGAGFWRSLRTATKAPSPGSLTDHMAALGHTECIERLVAAANAAG